MVGEMNEKEEAQSKPRSKKSFLFGSILLGVMLVEGLLVFVLVKHFAGPPQTAEAASSGLDAQEGEKEPQSVEVELVQFRAQNKQSKQTLVYDLTVYAVVHETHEEEFEELIQRKRQTIQDRFCRVVRAVDPQRFSEPDLATLRKQFEHELCQITGKEDMVKELLIPTIVAYSED